MKKILVVVDMQNDFIDGPLGTPEARAIVDNVCAKIREGEWDGIFHTKDTHHDYNYLDTQEGKNLPIPHCIYRKNGWYYTEKVMEALLSKSFMVEKSTFGATLLVDKLHELIYDGKLTADIELTLVGVCTDICVISNALLLKAHFPEMKIVVDASCCAGSTPEKHYMALEVMKSCQVDVVNNEYDIVRENVMKMVGKAFGVPEEFWNDNGEWITKNFAK